MFRVILAGGLTAGSLILLTGCGAATEVSSTSAVGSPQGRLPDDASAMDVTQAASRLVSEWMGTADQRQAAEVVVAHGENSPIANCMQRVGYPWYWSASTMPGDSFDPLAPSVWFASTDPQLVSKHVQLWGPFHRAEGMMNADNDVSADQASAVLSCEKAHDSERWTDETDEAVRNPEGASELTADWAKRLSAAGIAAAPFSAYADCMTSAKLSLLGGKEYSAATLAQAYAAAEPPPEEIPPTGVEGTAPEWAEFLKSEQEVSSADWSCRSQVYDTKMATLVPVINAFEDDHASELTHLSEYWISVEESAEALGWRPGGSFPISGE